MNKLGKGSSNHGKEVKKLKDDIGKGAEGNSLIVGVGQSKQKAQSEVRWSTNH